jgi:ureidoacrylate peracid hydrolase
MEGLRTDAQGWFGIAHDEWLDSSHTALLVIDMQNYDANRRWALIGTRGTGTAGHSAGAYYTAIEKTVVPSISRLLRFFRSRRMRVVHPLFASVHAGAPDMPPLWRLRFRQHAEDSGMPYEPFVGRPEMDIIGELAPLPGEPVLPKVTGSAFLSTGLDALFRHERIRSFVACGAWMNSCVEDTIRCGCDLGYLVTLAEDAAVAPDRAYQRAAVRVLGDMYCQVRTANWIIRRLSGGPRREGGSRRAPARRPSRAEGGGSP